MAAAWFDYANKTKAQVLVGADPGYTYARKVARNTVRIMYDNPFRIVFRYHATNVVTIYTDGLIILDSGGIRTRTTKARIEKYGRLKLRSVWIHRGYTNWILPDGRIFEDGMWWRIPEEEEEPDEGTFDVINFDDLDVGLPPDPPNPDNWFDNYMRQRFGKIIEKEEPNYEDWEPPAWKMPKKLER